MDQILRDAAEQGSIDALYKSLRDPAVQQSIDTLYLSLRAAEQGRIDALYQSTRDAAEEGNIDALYALLRTNADVLDSMDKLPFVDTPLHIAASLGHTQFAIEIIKLKPSLARKLNQDDFMSPMHLALRKLHDSQNDRALQRNLTQLVDRLLDVDKDLVRVKGKEDVTPLHYVAQIGDLHFFVKFFKACPESLEDVTIRRENVLHIALKHDMVEAFWLLVRWLWRTSHKDAILLEGKLLCSQDDEGNNLLPVDYEGNTLLHVAVSRNQPKVVWWLLDKGFADLNAKNSEGDTVFDLNARNLEGRHPVVDLNANNLEGHTVVDLNANNLEGHTVVDLNANNLEDNQRIKDMLMRQQRLLRCENSRILFLLPTVAILAKISRAIRLQQRAITEERRNALLVVAALLITVTYQAALGPDQQLNKFNCTAPINATGANQFNCTAWFNANSTEVNASPRHVAAFYSINTVTYYLSNVTLLFLLLPPDFIAIVLYFLLGLLFGCYCISTPLLNASSLSIIGIIALPSFPLFAYLTGVITSRCKFFTFVLLYLSYFCFVYLRVVDIKRWWKLGKLG